jgi:hypothetical protein
MIDFSCPRCGTHYHADESHLGKQIRCTGSYCEEIITVVWQDGRYTTSDQQLQTENERQSKSFSADDLRRRTAVLRRLKWNRGMTLGTIVVLLLAIGFAGYYIGVRRNELRPSPSAPANLSSSDFELAGSDTSGSKQAPQQSLGDQAKRDATTPPLPPGSWLIDPAKASDLKPPSRRGLKIKPPHAQDAPLAAISVPTGTRIIADQATSGRGELEAINGTFSDAFVIVVDNDTQKRVRDVSVQAKNSFLLDHLDQGNYRVVFATGTDWDSSAEHFRINPNYFEFEKALSFRESSGSYERDAITLNPVPGGNVRARCISEAEFHALSGKR